LPQELLKERKKRKKGEKSPDVLQCTPEWRSLHPVLFLSKTSSKIFLLLLMGGEVIAAVLQIFKDQMKMETFEAEAKMEDRQLHRKAQGSGKVGTDEVPPPPPRPWRLAAIDPRGQGRKGTDLRKCFRRGRSMTRV